MIEYLEIDQLKEMFHHVAERMIASEQMLTQIDDIIGDGDHGIGMAIGFKAVRAALPEMTQDSVNELFKEMGMTLLDAMGGASGVIFGTMLISGYGAAPKTNRLNLDLLSKMMQKSLGNIKERGRAKLGDKTMIDSLSPAVQALLEGAKDGRSLSEGLVKASIAADIGMEKTKTYAASMGRAQSYGDLSLGLPDPGAVSVSLIFGAMSSYVSSIDTRRE